MKLNPTQRMIAEARGIIDQADLEGRALTGDDRKYVNDLLERARERGEVEQQMADVGKALGPPMGQDALMGDGTGPRQGMATPGELFTSSEAFKSISDPSSRPSRWSTGEIEVWPVGFKANLLEGSGNPGSGTGGGLVSVPDVIPGLVQQLFQVPVFEQLLDSGLTSTNTVAYINEGTATSAAAGVLEGGTKPASSLGLGLKTSPVRKVATVTTVSEELLQDAPATQTYINGRLTTFVANEVDRQIARGTASGAEVQGFFNSSIPIYNRGTVDGNRITQTFNALNAVRGSYNIEPDWLVMHPTDYAILRLAQDQNGQYYAGGPWAGGYGSGSQQQTSGAITGTPDNLWGKPVYLTTAVGGPGTALLGTRSNARIYSNGGMRVEASTSDGSNFVQNLVTIRAERRLTMAILRTGGYCELRYGGTA